MCNFQSWRKFGIGFGRVLLGRLGRDATLLEER
jgi:hypothetical protein